MLSESKVNESATIIHKHLLFFFSDRKLRLFGFWTAGETWLNTHAIMIFCAAIKALLTQLVDPLFKKGTLSPFI